MKIGDNRAFGLLMEWNIAGKRFTCRLHPFMRICNPHDFGIRIFNLPSLTDDKCCNCASPDSFVSLRQI